MMTVTDEELDIVAHGGYDAGVRLGEVIEQDMIAVPASGPQREGGCGLPRLCCENMAPQSIRGIFCIIAASAWRTRSQYGALRWEFEQDGQPFERDGRSAGHDE